MTFKSQTDKVIEANDIEQENIYRQHTYITTIYAFYSPKYRCECVEAALSLYKMIGIIPWRATRLPILVTLALRHLYRRFSGHMRDQQVH